MANEISFTGSLTFNKNGVADTATGSKTTNVQTALTGIALHTVQVVGTSATMEVVLTGGDLNVASQTMLFLRNMDATNFVEISATTSNANTFAIMLAGESYGPARIPASAIPYMRSNAANVNVEVLVCEAGNPAS